MVEKIWAIVGGIAFFVGVYLIQQDIELFGVVVYPLIAIGGLVFIASLFSK